MFFLAPPWASRGFFPSYYVRVLISNQPEREWREEGSRVAKIRLTPHIFPSGDAHDSIPQEEKKGVPPFVQGGRAKLRLYFGGFSRQYVGQNKNLIFIKVLKKTILSNFYSIVYGQTFNHFLLKWNSMKLLQFNFCPYSMNFTSYFDWFSQKILIFWTKHTNVIKIWLRKS